MTGDIGTILLAALGISFLIFIHELGHFIAARLCGVRVETFSLGFGPRVFGWRRGDTDYRLSLVPLGGYVKMAGEYGDPETDPEAAPRDDDLLGKPAWQRLFIFSAGVLVNFAFAFAVFPLAFNLGVPFVAPVVGHVVPGGPAWDAGLQPNDEVVSVDDRRVYDFSDIALEVALGEPSGVVMRVQRAGLDAPFDVLVRPRRNESEQRYEAGILPASTDAIDVVPEGAAARAGLRSGDRIVSIGGVPFEEWARIPEPLTGEPLTIRYMRDGQEQTTRLTPAEVPELADRVWIGVRSPQTRIGALRDSALTETFPLLVDDVVLAIDGTPVFSPDEIDAALAAAASRPVPLRVRRGDDVSTITLAPEHRTALAQDVVFFVDPSTRVAVPPEGALADAGLRSGDVLLAINGQRVQTFTDVHGVVSEANDTRFTVRYERDGREDVVTVRARPVPPYDRSVASLGFGGRLLTEVHQEDWPGAVRAGYDMTINFLRTTWLTLTKLFTGDVGTKNLGGIVSISVLTYQFAELGIARLLFFLGLLSINLGFINLLPIPALDGGQIVFLGLEKIKGSKLSDRFLNGAQLAGLVLILLLIVYVTYNDIMRIAG